MDLLKRLPGAALAAALLAGLTSGPGAIGQEPARPGDPAANKPAEPKKFQDFHELTKDAKKYEGFLTLHEKEQHLYAEIKPGQLDQPILAPIVIARGSASAGNPLNFGDEWVLSFRRIDDKLQLVRRNVHFTAASGTPLEKAVKQNYTDSILMALPILSISPASGALVVDLGDVFMGDFAQVGLGSIDKNRSRWFKIRAYPNNVEIQVEATFTGGRFGSMFFGGGASPVVDPRGMTMVIHYSLCKAPESGYKPRLADYRVGHFLNAVTDYSQANPDTDAKRMINRWRLEKSDPKAKLSPPKKQIVWWIEDNVPLEHRPYVEQGILEWNKAFEKIGFLNAMAVRWQNEQDDFEPEDINYCTLRWITTGSTYAMSGLRSDPMTGEMIDGDVIFDASWIKTWKEEYAMIVGVPTPVAQGGDTESVVPLAMAEVVSPIMASKQGFGLPVPPPGSRRDAVQRAARVGLPTASGASAAMALDVVPIGWDPIQAQLYRRMSQGRLASCNYSAAKSSEMRFASLALASLAAEEAKKDGDKDKKPEEPKLPEGFLGQAIKEVVMHEVGHSLGLRHNFKASVMLRPEEVNDTNVTHAKGMAGSVMDYNPINVAPKGQKQGDYASTTIGPYDYWAIEYAYKPIDGDEAAELKKVAAKSPDPDLTFATDDDFYNYDPQVNTYDLTNDTLAYGRQRMEMAAELLKDLDKKVVRDDESWSRLRSAFGACVSQFGNGAYLAAEYIGGQSVSRDFKGSEKAKDPVVPVAGDKQREALKLLVDRILSDKAFQFSPALLRKLVRESWQDHGFSLSGGVGYPIYGAILNIQGIALDECLAASTLQRLQNQEAQSEPGANPLKIEEVFRSFTDGVFSELAPPPAGPSPTSISTIRRNLQREYVKRLSTMVLGPKSNDGMLSMYSYVILLGGSSEVPPDAKNLARLHLDEIARKIDEAVARKEPKIDDTTLAHLKELRHRIDQVLKASLNANEP
ncbi:zinc-dependent metalloprotease [Paludisphaera mucosa]|uniref:Zinc-dependent metalloprotease n=1 Tax=Paludisphaera mucosa TaxID=3030827 RepID=A0ABT6FER3_9BACT|nr:zinc-dependent metalloprotease [Paludisphaera mucosa]MDG3006069.1 zinc-dependent metalloprotease [Paludisphaera mucosa]